MSKKQVFIDFIKPFIENSNDIPKDAQDYWIALTAGEATDRPEFTDKGKLILQFLQTHQDISMWKAKDIAEGLNLGAKNIAGSARKLANDGYIERVGQNPIFYALTEKGKNYIFED